MARNIILFLLTPALLWAQEFEFSQEWDSIHVEIEGCTTPAAWTGGCVRSAPELFDWDGDADYDLVTGGFDIFLYSFRNIGNSTACQFAFDSSQFNGIDCSHLYSYLNPASCDIDADGDYDLFI